MNQEVKEKWVAALRSGDYEQGKSHLRENGKYCCLGVLCNTVNPDGWKGDFFVYKGEEDRNYLPSNFLEEVGLEFVAERKLAYSNDQGATFDEIADQIEKDVQ
jgi:hypothetical protein